MLTPISITHANNATFSYFRWVPMPGYLPLTGGFRMQFRRPSTSAALDVAAELSSANGRISIIEIDEANERVKLGFDLPGSISRSLIGIYETDCMYEDVAADIYEPVLKGTITFEQGVTR